MSLMHWLCLKLLQPKATDTPKCRVLDGMSAPFLSAYVRPRITQGGMTVPQRLCL